MAISPPFAADNLNEVRNGSSSEKIFIDASYEGDLMAEAGVKSRIGREVMMNTANIWPASAWVRIKARRITVIRPHVLSRSHHQRSE